MRQVSITPQPELPQGGVRAEEEGEAVVIDLGDRGMVFAVMGTDDYWTFFNAFAPENNPSIVATVKGLRYYKSVKGKSLWN